MKTFVFFFVLFFAVGAQAQGLVGRSIQPLPERNLTRESILERLVDARTTLESWNIAGTRTQLDQLITDLTGDASAFNQAVRKKTQEIVGDLSASHLRDAETSLNALVQSVRDGVMPSFANPGDSAAN